MAKQEWDASILVTVPAPVHPDDLNRKLHAFADRLAELPYVQYETAIPAFKNEPAVLKAQIIVTAENDGEALTQATRAGESAADAAGLPITAVSPITVHQRLKTAN